MIPKPGYCKIVIATAVVAVALFASTTHSQAFRLSGDRGSPLNWQFARKTVPPDSLLTTYTRADVVKQLKHYGSDLFIAEKGLLLFASFSGDVLTIYTVEDKRIEGKRRRLTKDDPLIAFFKSRPEADLFIQSCGSTFGVDEKCDQYSQIGQQVLAGTAIKENKTALKRFESLLSIIGQTLSETSPTAARH